MRGIFTKGKVLTTVLLLAVITVVEGLFYWIKFPTWPLFLCMIAFFLAEEKFETKR